MKRNTQRLLTASALVGPLLLGVSHLRADDARVQWLRDHAVLIRAIDPADEDFSDLQPLKAILADARIVQLGEQSHGDGATFHAKTRLVKFLHREMGFDVLAFESGLYDCGKAWELLTAGVDAEAAAAMGIFPIWTRSTQVTPLVTYLGAAAATDQPLELCGFDCQFTGRASREHLAADLERFLEEQTDRVDERDRRAVLSLLQSLLDGSETPDEAMRHEWENAVNEICSALTQPETESGAPDRDLEFWRQELRSLWTYAQMLWQRMAGAQDETLPERFNRRDAQMADNLRWLAARRYPDRKIIVWAATMHLIRSPHLIETGEPRLDYTGVEPMGHLVSEALGEEVFTIGFTAYEGEAGIASGPSWPLQPAAEGSFEDLCAQAGLSAAFVNFRDLEDDCWLHGPLVARPLGYMPMTATWPRLLDGMIFTRTMYPSTRYGGAPEPRADPKTQEPDAR